LAKNRGVLLGSAEKTVFGKVTDKIIEIPPSDIKLSVLYRVSIKQNAISKRAYEYFKNIKKNTDKIGDIFAPIPSELRGNIVCTTDPGRSVIGYVDVSLTMKNHRFISRQRDRLYEPPYKDCTIYSLNQLMEMYKNVPGKYVLINPEEGKKVEDGDENEDDDAEKEELIDEPYVALYAPRTCVDCTTIGGTTQKPDDWQND
jgi:hypothetical protein